MSRLVEIAKSIGRFEVGAKEIRNLIRDLKNPSPSAHFLGRPSLALDIINLGVRYHLWSHELEELAQELPPKIAREDYLGATVDLLVIVTPYEIVKYGAGKLLGYLSDLSRQRAIKPEEHLI